MDAHRPRNLGDADEAAAVAPIEARAESDRERQREVAGSGGRPRAEASAPERDPTGTCRCVARSTDACSSRASPIAGSAAAASSEPSGR